MHFGRVVAHADHGVGAELLRVLEHQLERFGAGLLAELADSRVMLPPTSVCSDAPIVPNTDRKITHSVLLTAVCCNP